MIDQKGRGSTYSTLVTVHAAMICCLGLFILGRDDTHFTKHIRKLPMASATLWHPHHACLEILKHRQTSDCLCATGHEGFRNNGTNGLKFIDNNEGLVILEKGLPASFSVKVKSNGPPCTDVLEAVFAGVGENNVIVPADIFALPDGTYQLSGSFSLAGKYELRVRLLFQSSHGGGCTVKGYS
jgi:hypothetical protein